MLPWHLLLLYSCLPNNQYTILYTVLFLLLFLFTPPSINCYIIFIEQIPICRFEQVLMLPGHRSSVWAIDVAYDGSFCVSAGQVVIVMMMIEWHGMVSLFISTTYRRQITYLIHIFLLLSFICLNCLIYLIEFSCLYHSNICFPLTCLSH